MAVLSDSFHLLSDTRALFLKQLGALLHDSGLLSGGAIEAIQNGAAAYFDEITSTDRRRTFAEEANGLTSSRLTLLGEDDLELGIRLDNLSAQLFESTGGSLWRTHLRFVTLLKRPDLPKSANPIGPKGIAQGLNAMFDATGAIGIDKKLELLEQIEACLVERLPTLYAEINDFLDRGGVEAAQATIIGSQEGPVKTDASAVRENSLLALQQALLARAPGIADAIQFQPGSGAAASLLNQATLERLILRLDELDRQGVHDPVFAPTGATGSLFPELHASDSSPLPAQPKALNSAELGIPATAGESLAIDTLATIFETIFANPALPDALKAVISSLQITLLKVAMKDSSLFTNEQHPARSVIDRMGLAVLGLPADVTARHPVYVRLFEIATRLRGEKTGDTTAFEKANAQLGELLAERNATIADAAKSYEPLIDELERNDEMARQVRPALEKFMATNPPKVIRNFLEQVWSPLLQSIWLEHGEQSSEWQESLALVDELLWTIQPKADADERKTLARRLPDILKRLRAGMKRIGLPAEAEAAFLDDCFELQTRALRALPMPEANEAPAGTDGATASTGALIAGKVQSDGLSLATLDFAEVRPATSLTLPCKTGDWLEISQASGEKCIARLCHVGPKSGRLLLLNPDAGLALAIHPAVLDKQLRDGEAAITSASSLFESAASAALRLAAGR